MKNIKKVAVSVFISVISLSAVFSQSDNQGTTETLFSGNGSTKVGFMGSIYYNGSGFDGDMANAGGGKIGVIFNQKITIGAFGQFSGELRPDSETLSAGNYLDMRQAGGFVEYTLSPEKVVHFTFPLLIGAGEIEFDNEQGNLRSSEENFFFVEPRALIEVNLHKYVRLNAGLGYRWVSDMSYSQLTEQDIRNLTFNIGLKAGLFR